VSAAIPTRGLEYSPVKTPPTTKTIHRPSRRAHGVFEIYSVVIIFSLIMNTPSHSPATVPRSQRPPFTPFAPSNRSSLPATALSSQQPLLAPSDLPSLPSHPVTFYRPRRCPTASSRLQLPQWTLTAPSDITSPPAASYLSRRPPFAPSRLSPPLAMSRRLLLPQRTITAPSNITSPPVASCRFQ
jgi:hypothetical protein